MRIDSLSLQEGAIIKYLQRELRKLGVRPSRTGKVRGGEAGSLLALVPGRGLSHPRLLLNAHVDTVAPGQNIKLIEQNGQLLSDGSTVLGADNKAGVAAILEILRVLKEKKLQHPPLRIIFTVAEEIGLLGAKALPENAFRADCGLVLDGGDIDTIINQAPSQYNLSATIIGRAAHAGLHPEEGINAIKVASQAIAKMKLGRIDSETTANIGVIEGGQATNIVPAKVELKGEARSHNLKKLSRQVQQMERTLLRACQKARARLKLKVERVYRSFEVDSDSRLINLVQSGLRRTGIKPVIKKTGGGSDANIFNERGVPSVIVGVGADRVHTTREQLKIADFVSGTRAVLNIILGAGEWKK